MSMNQMLFRAMTEKLPLEIIYLSAKGKITQRTIIIKEIRHARIRAYCFLRKQMRYFLIHNILSVMPAKQKYKLPG